MTKAEKEQHFKKHGWLKIRSKVLSQDFYLVRNSEVAVPNKGLLRIDQGELDALKGLPEDDLRTMFQAKQIFKGHISKPDSQRVRPRRKNRKVQDIRKQKAECKVPEARQQAIRF